MFLNGKCKKYYLYYIFITHVFFPIYQVISNICGNNVWKAENYYTPFTLSLAVALMVPATLMAFTV